MSQVEQQLREVLASVGATGQVAAVDIDSDRHVGLAADQPAVLASVFKLPILLELQRRAIQGDFNLTARLRIPAAGRSRGPTGLSVMLDDVELSLRDAALSMMSVSDNAATDVVLAMVGAENVTQTMRDLGLASIIISQSCDDLYRQLAADVGLGSPEEVEEVLGEHDQAAGAVMERARTSLVLDPAATNSATPADITRLLQLIWTDQAGPPEACAEVRRVLGLQVWPHRLRSGFPDHIAVAGKTGTLPFARNEAGVVEYPDGGRYAVAVFLRLEGAEFTLPDADRAIGTLARIAVEGLRAER